MSNKKIYVTGKRINSAGEEYNIADTVTTSTMAATPFLQKIYRTQAPIEEVLEGYFKDSALFNSTDKTVVSVRDGVLEYMGAELGIEPADKVFKIYRSPATIAKAALDIVGIPVTLEHVDVDSIPPKDGGVVESAEVIDHFDEFTASALAVKNKVNITDKILRALDSMKELSLGYKAKLVPHSTYDFEQRDIIPHHLAVVEQGRCGSSCSFIDKKTVQENVMNENVKNTPTGEETKDQASYTIDQVIEMVNSLPEMIQKMPVDQLQGVMQKLSEIVTAKKPESENEVEMQQEDEKKEELMDEKKICDSKLFKDTVSKAVKSATSEYVSVFTKAKDFLPETYSFSDKSTLEIMRDAVNTQHTEKFTDAELPVAFKLLKKNSNYSNFGDRGTESILDKLKDKEI